jgi:dipeptidyl aminopeptidase/acylaminoacyl peptidase
LKRFVMNKFSLLLIIFVILVAGGIGIVFIRQPQQIKNIVNKQGSVNTKENQYEQNPLSIGAMRKRNYPGSDLVIEETLAPGSNYNQYIASYMSDGLKIYGLLTVPQGQKPKDGWPVIIFNHGYIPPEQYRTTERYVAYVDVFARNGYIVFKSDYRGNGSSGGQPEGAYYSPAYAVDVLNALSSLKRYPEADPNRIGMWGHSMGGNITLRDIVVDTKDIKAAVIWGGVVGSYDDLMNNWQRRVRYQPSQRELAQRNNYRQNLVSKYGTPQTNPQFWQAVDPTYYLSDITTPIQLHTGGNDEEVPVAFSANLQDKLEKIGKTVEYYNYPGGDHNISSPNFEPAMQRSIDFFNKYLKPPSA